MKILQREFIYIWYYFDVQLRQILPYWVVAVFIGYLISVFGKERLRRLMDKEGHKEQGILGVIPASLLGIASPLCMYGTIPLLQQWLLNGMSMRSLSEFLSVRAVRNFLFLVLRIRDSLRLARKGFAGTKTDRIMVLNLFSQKCPLTT